MADKELKVALRKMLQAELDAMQYYQQATRFMQDDGAIFHFDQLALEELEHARTFYDIYPDDDLPSFEQLVSELSNHESTLKGIDQHLVSRLTEQNALKLAIKMEKAVAESLQEILKQVQSSAARIAIEKNIESTLGHLELIEQDYERMYR